MISLILSQEKAIDRSSSTRNEISWNLNVCFQKNMNCTRTIVVWHLLTWRWFIWRTRLNEVKKRKYEAGAIGQFWTEIIYKENYSNCNLSRHGSFCSVTPGGTKAHSGHCFPRINSSNLSIDCIPHSIITDNMDKSSTAASLYMSVQNDTVQLNRPLFVLDTSGK